MSTSGPRRKARIIQTLEDDEPGADNTNQTEVQAPIKFTRKPNKSSSLRKSINVADIDRDGHDSGAQPSTTSGAPKAGADADDDEANAPVVIRPSVSRSGSTKQKRKPASSRLSFGVDAAQDDSTSTSTPSAVSKPLSQKAAENALRKKPPISLPSRFLGGEDDRPRYSKEYLSELQSSTPNTPHDLSTLTLDDGEEMEMSLDPSELDGATVVNTQPSMEIASRTQPAATILSAAQVREKKERRARLALQGGEEGEGYIALSDEEDNRLGRKEKDSRLIAEDEDLGEGYDEYVEDGGIALGRAAERKARQRRKREMAELIAGAEDSDDGEGSDDSLDLKTEYEAAQRRKGMGVEVLGGQDGEEGTDVIPKMKPLPELKECLQRMRDLVQGLEDEVRHKRERIEALRKEREEIVKREGEVQGVLDQAGQKYQAVLGTRPDAAKLAAQSPLRTGMPPGMGVGVPGLPVERGLESFGTTPARVEDEEMTG